jgi:hypothetical protein
MTLGVYGTALYVQKKRAKSQALWIHTPDPKILLFSASYRDKVRMMTRGVELKIVGLDEGHSKVVQRRHVT